MTSPGRSCPRWKRRLPISIFLETFLDDFPAPRRRRRPRFQRDSLQRIRQNFFLAAKVCCVLVPSRCWSQNRQLSSLRSLLPPAMFTGRLSPDKVPFQIFSFLPSLLPYPRFVERLVLNRVSRHLAPHLPDIHAPFSALFSLAILSFPSVFLMPPLRKFAWLSRSPRGVTAVFPRQSC